MDQVQKPKKTLAKVTGLTACGLILGIVCNFEGVVLKGYLDPVGIPTKCAGITRDVVVGQAYTAEECRQALEVELIAHAEPVLNCTPVLKDHPYQLSAAVSFAYNVGTNAYCNSTAAKRFNSGDFKGACKSFNENDSGKLQWVSANGKILPGLVKRRAAERKLCETGLYYDNRNFEKPSWLDSWCVWFASWSTYCVGNGQTYW